MNVKKINLDTIEQDIYNTMNEFLSFYAVDIYNLDDIKKIPHNIITAGFSYIYKKLFIIDCHTYCEYNSIIDYNNLNELSIIVNAYINLGLLFNKSFGLMQFATMTGIDYTTLLKWYEEGEDVNPERFNLITKIKDSHKAQHINLLNETTLGQVAVANNDTELGLEWTKKNQPQITNNTVYLLESERKDRLGLTVDKQGASPGIQLQELQTIDST